MNIHHPHAWWMDVIELCAHCHTIETVNSQPEQMDSERLPSGANAKFEWKVPRYVLIACIGTNMDEQSR